VRPAHFLAYKTGDPKDKDMTEFEGVIPTLGQALHNRGFETLTPVQQAVLAPELGEADALVSAQTGSGKTVAFGLALGPTLLKGADRFERARAPLALVIAPTRELALQVKRELEWLYEHTGASLVSCVGGMDMRDERRALNRGAHIVVGTPGRLRDHIERGSFDSSSLKAVVLDEADEMLDLGFRDDLEYILDSSPSQRRTLMFSATVPRSITGLAKRYQRDAVRVSTTSDQEQHLDIEYRALTIAPNDRENAIINVLRYFEAQNALVFCATRATVNHMTARLNNRGFSVVALSGELSQNERTHALQAMRDGRARVCVATDVAARGIDLPNLELVIHADLPKNRESLLHRSGRTGRAGRKGVCTLIVPHNWRRRTERLLGSANVEATWAKPPSAKEIMVRDRQRILEDPALSAPLSEFEQTFVDELLAKHSAEQVAAAFVRQNFAERTAPEELIDTGPVEARQQKTREDFKNGVWFSLSVGREQNAEPGWLLPMLCRAGHITKKDIGAIRIQQSETFVELSPDSVEKFQQAIGPGGKIDKDVTLTRLDGIPEMTRGAGKKSFAKKKPYKGDKPGASGKFKPKHKFTKQQRETDGGDKSHKKPWEKTDSKGKSKKPYKSQFHKDGPAEPGSNPLKRKKKKKKPSFK
jgi:ATP-dependent RNA helicase DeaD